MFISCPHCGFLVALIVPPHGAAQHCPRCDGTLRVEPAEAVNPLEASPSESGAAGLETSYIADGADADPINEPGVAANLPDDTASAAATPAATPAAAQPPSTRSRHARRVPSFVRGSPPVTTARVAWPWHAAIVALGLALVLQLLLAQRDELAASARWRPWVEGLCNALPCEIPAWREPHAFTMLNRSVQPSRTLPGALAVEASFRNDARWPQPWPALLLSLSDVEGRQVGMRAFAPSEYHDGAVGADDLIAPGQSATVRLQVREPVPRIVAYTFDFQ